MPILLILFLSRSVIHREPTSYITEFNPVPRDYTLPRSVCSSEEQGTAVRELQDVSPSLISSLAKSSAFVFVSLDQDLGGDSKGWKEGVCRSKGWTPTPQKLNSENTESGTSPSWSDSHHVQLPFHSCKNIASGCHSDILSPC